MNVDARVLAFGLFVLSVFNPLFMPTARWIKLGIRSALDLKPTVLSAL